MLPLDYQDGFFASNTVSSLFVTVTLLVSRCFLLSNYDMWEPSVRQAKCLTQAHMQLGSVKIRKQIRHYLASAPVPFFLINNIWTRPKIKKLQKYVLQKISISPIPVPLFSSPEAATVNGFLGV